MNIYGLFVTKYFALVATPGIRVQVERVHMHFNVKGFKIITLHSIFQSFLQHFTKKT